MKKILFIVLPHLQDCRVSAAKKNQYTAFPYGVLSIATHLKKNTDAELRIFDCNVSEGLPDLIHSFKPDIIALSMMFDNQYKHLPEILQIIKSSASNKPVIVIGGTATTANFDEILAEQPDIDAVCYGEGELAFFDLITSGYLLFPSWVTRDHKQPRRTVLKDLDAVIDLDYSLVNIDDYPCREAFSPFASQEKERQFYIITSRGCNFSCTFCMNSANPDKTIRYASVDAVIKHVRKLVDQGMTVLTFYDDQLLFNKKRAKEIFRQLAPFKLKIECPNGLSVAFIDAEMAQLMKEAGMASIKLAIESGSPYVLGELMHKPLKVPMIKPVVKLLHDQGFWVQGFFVIGMPGETDEHRKETLDMIRDVELDWGQFNTACPIKGSALYTECIKKGYISPLTALDYTFKEYCINQPEYTPEHIIREAYRMNLDVNFVNNRNMRLGDYETAIKAFLDVITLIPDHAFAYYYLSECERELDKRRGLNTFDPTIYRLRFFDILSENHEWRKWAEEFGLVTKCSNP